MPTPHGPTRSSVTGEASGPRLDTVATLISMAGGPIGTRMVAETDGGGIEVFCGSPAASLEFALVLDAGGIPYQRVDRDGHGVLWVEAGLAGHAAEELRRYALERAAPRTPDTPPEVFAGAGIGAIFYAAALILVAYCAGQRSFGIDWLAAGAIESGHALQTEWWRPLTALTLHLDQEHLMGNLLFGVGIGILTGRSIGPGVAWLAILSAATGANALDMMASPPWHRAVGASTAVFAALGLLTGLTWSRQPSRRDRPLYRWAPLFGGGGLLILLGAGNEHVDVVGHVFGFVVGLATGVSLTRMRGPRGESPTVGGERARSSRAHGAALQWGAGALTLALIAAAWVAALRHAM